MERELLNVTRVERINLYNHTLNNEYVYYERKPAGFPKNERFKHGVYLFDCFHKVEDYSDRLCVKTDADGVKRVYNLPYIEFIMVDGSNIVKRYKSYKAAEKVYNSFKSTFFMQEI